MARIMVMLIALGVFLSPAVQAAEAEKPPEPAKPPEAEKPAKDELATEAAKLSYSFGLEIGNALKGLDTEVDLASFLRGVEDNLKGRKPLLTEDQADAVKKAFFKTMQEKQVQKQKELAEKNEKEGAAFLVENKKKKDVVETKSGLQYTVIKEGDGAKPTADSLVKVHYHGTLLDGKVFDSSVKRNKPVTFPVSGVIPGWTEALQLMKVGSKYKVFIPAKLAYGERGAGEDIGPGTVLIFEVELLGIEKAPELDMEDDAPAPAPKK